MSQGLIAGLAAAFASGMLNDPETACVPTDQLLVYAVRLRLLKMRTLYAKVQKI
jgi:hypothetical protein